jgi:hypothetical protein
MLMLTSDTISLLLRPIPRYPHSGKSSTHSIIDVVVYDGLYEVHLYDWLAIASVGESAYLTQALVSCAFESGLECEFSSSLFNLHLRITFL